MPLAGNHYILVCISNYEINVINTGIGVLFGKEDLLNQTQPWQGGGNMIQDVTFEHTKFHDAPNRFEAGTGNIADAVGLGAAIDYVNKIGIDVIHSL